MCWEYIEGLLNPTPYVQYPEASHNRQILVGLADASLVLALIITLFSTGKPEALYQYLQGINSYLLAFLVFISYRLISLFFFDQTLGMRIFGVVLLNGQEEPLTFLEKSLAAIFILYRGTGYYHAKASAN